MFYCGNIENIKDGISLAGLTKVSKKDRTYTRKLVDKIIDNNLSYISNDSKGIDEVALHYALRQIGRAHV